MSQVAIRDQSERTSIQSVAFGIGPGGGHLAPQNLGDIVRFAEVMSKADIAIPKHLRGNPGACLAVCMQAMKWEMDPFSVAQKSYKVGDQMAYEAQLIAAVINTRAGLRRRPQIEYEGRDGDRKCRVTFEALDGSVHVYESPRFGAITTKNSPLWKSDPDQQLGYYSIRAGARRHFPEVILGVYDRDEIEAARDVTPAQPERSSFAARIAQPQEPTGPREGFDRDFIDAELGGREEPAQASNEAEEPGAVDESEIDHGTPSAKLEESLFDETQRDRLTRYCRDVLTQAGSEGDAALLRDRIGKTHIRWKTEMGLWSAEESGVAERAFKAAQSVARGETNLTSAVTFVAGEIGVEEAAVTPGADG